VLQDISPDVIHTHGLKPHVFAAATAPADAALVWHMHDLLSDHPFARRLIPIAARRVDAAIAVSQPVKAELDHACRARVPVSVIPNAVDLERYSPLGSTLDLDKFSDLAPATDGTIRVGLISTAGRYKGHEVFLQALASLAKQPAVRGYVIGGALYRTSNSEISQDDLRNLTASLGISHRVGFTGHLQDSASAMRALDIVVHATVRAEPFGLVVAEAMACGRAVVASDAGGVREIIQPNIDGLIHQPGNATSLSEAIGKLVNSYELRARLGRAARQTAEMRFDRNRLAPAVAIAYKAAVERRRKRNRRET
jgi:glycosyltransferase involved in cell wall biosynthesis